MRNLKAILAKLERLQRESSLVNVRYKDGGTALQPIEQAILDLRCGAALSITACMTRDEMTAFRRAVAIQLEEHFAGDRRDEPEPFSMCRMIYASMPFAVVAQDESGGCYVDAHGECFHSGEVDEYAKRHGVGFVIVKDYEASLEPWNF